MSRLTRMDRTVIQCALNFVEAGELDEEAHGFGQKELQHAISAIRKWNSYSSEELDNKMGRGTNMKY